MNIMNRYFNILYNYLLLITLKHSIAIIWTTIVIVITKQKLSSIKVKLAIRLSWT